MTAHRGSKLSRKLSAAVLTLAFVGGWGGAAQGETQNWALPMECGEAMEASSREGFRCLKFRLDGAVGDYAAHLIEQQGQALFGEHFGFVHRLSWSPFSTGTRRNLDAVIPLQFALNDTAPKTGSALFVQSGITRWQDSAGFTRNDVRHGFVYRFALSDERNIFGMSTFFQENVERSHKRLVITLDYAGQYGTGWLQHFVPASDWQPGRLGYEERVIGGTELGVNLGITSTLSLDAALTRWNDESAKDLYGRVGVDFRPHRWLNFRAGYESGLAGDAANVHGQLKIPLGGAPKRLPRWEGLGVLGVAETLSGMWRPVENVEELQTVERLIAPAAAARVDSVAVEFLQTEAATGSEIGVRVSIPAPLPEDLSLVLRLAPGSGSNPAVSGEDFVDEPQRVIIAKGTTSATVYLQLLDNANLQTDRSLAVTVFLDSSS